MGESVCHLEQAEPPNTPIIARLVCTVLRPSLQSNRDSDLFMSIA